MGMPANQQGESPAPIKRKEVRKMTNKNNKRFGQLIKLINLLTVCKEVSKPQDDEIWRKALRRRPVVAKAQKILIPGYNKF